MGHCPLIRLLVVLLGLLLGLITHGPIGAAAMSDLKLEPSEAVVSSGSSVTFNCSYPRNTSFEWVINGPELSLNTTEGISFINNTEDFYFWSRLTVFPAKRGSSGEVACIADDGMLSATSFLVVNGVPINGACTDADDCTTNRAICRNGTCQCPRNEVLLKLTKSGYDACRQTIYRLHDRCEFSEQCAHLVDRKSVCSPKGVCVCNSQTVEFEGRCVANGFTALTKDQELYKVGLVAVTCFILAIVAISLWVTLKNEFSRSCNEEGPRQLPRTLHAETDCSNDVIMEISEDKPPSYDEVHNSTDNVLAPPNFKEALKSSVAAKRLLRQVSAPAGQLFARAISFKRN